MNKDATIFFVIFTILLAGCLVDDPDFKVNSKDAILASRKHVVVTPAPTETIRPNK